MYMKRIVIILIGLISVAYGQSSPTSSKTRFVNGLYVGTKLDSYFNAADSNAIYWRADSALMAKYKGAARRVLFVSDSATYFDQVVRTFGTQTVGGNKTFSNDLNINGITAGRGNGNSSTNTVFGSAALANASTMFSGTNSAFGILTLNALINGTKNTAIGTQALSVADNAEENTAVGYLALAENTSGDKNIALGNQAGYGGGGTGTTTGSNNIFIGYKTQGLTRTGTNELVLGNELTGNGSNTVTIGNSSVTDNYFSGKIRGANLTVGIGEVDNQTLFNYPGSFSTIYRLNGLSNQYGFNIDSSSQNAFYTISEEGTYHQAFYKGDGFPTTNIWGVSSKTNAESTWTNRLALNQNGNFGINTNNPTYLLDVNGKGRFSDSLIGGAISGNSLTSIGSIRLGNTNEITWGGTYGANIPSIIGVSGASGYLTFFPSGSTNGEAARFNNNNTFTLTTLGTGTVYSNSGTLTNTDPSDSTIKNTINPHKYGLAEVMKLQPKSFYYNSDTAKASLKYGFIAQEVKSIMPDMVRKIDPKSDSSKLGLESQGIYVTMVKAIQEQQAIIESLLTRIKALEAKLN